MITVSTFADRVEIFYTIQGEGRNIGLPVIFVRTSFCNLACSWCDAWYTWNFEGTKFENCQFPKVNRKSHQVRMTADEIIAQIKKTSSHCKRIVLTGGEPLLQQKELIPLLRKLKEDDYRIEVETNGTIIPDRRFDAYVSQYNCSPKLENSGNSLKLRRVDDALTAFANRLWLKTWFKFVVTSDEDLTEVFKIVSEYGIVHDKVFLMPEGTNEEILKARALSVVEVCKEHGFRFTPRLQIELYGMKPGT